MRQAIAACGLLCLALLAGCGQPKVQPNNLELTVTLRTALSTQNAEWLAMNVAAIEERHTAGLMNDDEYAAFQSIVATAKAGDWESAERAAVRLQKAQRPTAEQVSRLPGSP